MLTVHKNTRTQRSAKDIRKLLHDDVKKLASMENISGYAVVVWNGECRSACGWKSTPPVMPGLVVPEFAKKVIEREIAIGDAQDVIDEALS